MEISSTIAVDWSGAQADGPRRSWLAEVRDGELVELRNGWSVHSLGAWLAAHAEADPRFVAGLDFAFSFPAWYVRERFGGSLAAAWGGEHLISEPPFWGRSGKRRPPLDPARPQLREAERSSASGRPKSIFQVGGAGSVGTGSVRGMPLLASLQRARFAIWPFDPPRLPLVIEIYPRALTGRVVKSDPAARWRYVEQLAWPADPGLRSQVAASEDAFDAAISALRLFEHRSEFDDLPPPTDLARLEGWIWQPRAGASP